ncbi:MAG: hypothetical protein AAGB00_00155 [Planctomycetota bacterium]
MPAIDPRNIEVVDPAQAALFRKATTAQRIAMIGSASRTARMMIAGGVRCRHPDWDGRRVAEAVAARMSGEDERRG